MKKTNGKTVAMEWINGQVDLITERLLEVLNDNCKKELADIRREVAIGIHNVAFFNILKTVNFPTLPVGGIEELAAVVLGYDEFANAQCDKLIAFCKTLSQWKPDAPPPAPLKVVVTRKRGRKPRTPDLPQATETVPPGHDQSVQSN